MSKHAHILHGKGELIAEFDFSLGQLLLRQLAIHDTRIAQVSYIIFALVSVHICKITYITFMNNVI